MNAALESPPAANGGAAPEWAPPHPSLALDFCGLRFASPIVLLSGCVGYGEEYTRVAGFSNRDVGAVCLQGTTLAPRLGHRPHRLCELPDGLLAATGMQNPGVDVVVAELLPLLDFSETRFIANVWGATLADYVALTARFDASPVAAIELNLSSPDLAQAEDYAGTPQLTARVVAACRAVTRKPLIAKLGAGPADIALAARACIEAGADALAVINAVAGHGAAARVGAPVLGHGPGGLSGPAIKPLALQKVAQADAVARPHGVPLIGQGGITTPADAIEFLQAGATAIGIGTGLFYDPLLCPKVNRALAARLAA